MRINYFTKRFALSRRSVVLFLLAALISWASLAVPASHAQSPKQLHSAALQSLTQMIAKAQQQDRMPKLSDPAVTKVFKVITDQDRLYGTAAFPVDLSDNSVCAPASQIFIAYLSFMDQSLRKTAQQRGLNSAQQTMMAISANTITYQNEIVPLGNFSIHCGALIAQETSKFMRSLPPEQLTPVRRQGLAMMRNSLAQAITSMIMFSIDDEITDSHRKEIIANLEQEMPTMVAIMPLNQRNALTQNIQQVLEIAPRARRALYQGLIETSQEDSCRGMCRIQ
jgi:hypothetical protein